MVSAHFSRTTRAIYADSLQPVLIGLTFLVVLMAGWAGWFFFAKIQLYETSPTARFTKAGVIVADFPAKSLPRLRRGQSAFFYPTGEHTPAVAIAAVVVSVTPGVEQVQLSPQGDASARAHLLQGVAGRVEVVVDELSPASLVIQAAGLAPAS